MTTEELIALIRLVMGNPPESVLPDAVIQMYIEVYLLQYPESECKALYYSILSCYQWLIGQSGVGSSGGGKRREKNGKREVEIDKYNKSGDWQAAMDSFIKNPSLLLPQCAVEFKNNGGLGRVIVGGVREDRIKDVKDDSNQRDGGASEKSGVTYDYSNDNLRRDPNNSFLLRKD